MTEIKPEFDGIEIESGPNVEFAIVWLHGLGADGNDFVPVVPELKLPLATRFVFPHAPVRPVTINGGYPMRAWYDIVSFDRGAGEDVAGVRASSAILGELIDREAARGIPAERIVIAGFSQGGAVALYAALTGRRPLSGVLALSTYLPAADTVFADEAPVNSEIPVWMGHGDHDPVIQLSVADRSRQQMEAAGIDVDWHTYPMPHSLCPLELQDIAEWLTQRQLLA